MKVNEETNNDREPSFLLTQNPSNPIYNIIDKKQAMLKVNLPWHWLTSRRTTVCMVMTIAAITGLQRMYLQVMFPIYYIYNIGKIYPHPSNDDHFKGEIIEGFSFHRDMLFRDYNYKY